MKKLKEKISQGLLRRKFSAANSVSSSATISRNTVMGGGCVVGKNVNVGPDVVLSQGAHIGDGVSLSRITVGENSFIESGVMCTGHGEGKITIGKESYVGLMNVLDWSHDIKIGDYVHIGGPGAGVWTHSTANMCMNSIPLSQLDDEQYRPRAPVVIENNVYIGGNSTIYPGVTIHHHSIVAPNSAVTKDVEAYTVVGGVPARVIRKIDKSDNNGSADSNR